MRYLLDTNICVHRIQCHPPELLRRFQEFDYGDLLISVVTLAGLRHGVERDPGIKYQADFRDYPGLLVENRVQST